MARFSLHLILILILIVILILVLVLVLVLVWVWFWFGFGSGLGLGVGFGLASQKLDSLLQDTADHSYDFVDKKDVANMLEDDSGNGNEKEEEEESQNGEKLVCTIREVFLALLKEIYHEQV